MFSEPCSTFWVQLSFSFRNCFCIIATFVLQLSHFGPKWPVRRNQELCICRTTTPPPCRSRQMSKMFDVYCRCNNVTVWTTLICVYFCVCACMCACMCVFVSSLKFEQNPFHTEICFASMTSSAHKLHHILFHLRIESLFFSLFTFLSCNVD